MRRAFSLIELLLSVFILAIGIISVSALFPAGIAQQQQTADDQLGPVVAEQALGLLRSRVKTEDFGTFEEFGVTNLLAQSISNGSYVFRPSAGDWSWIRPGVIRSNQSGTTIDDVGAIDIFSTLAQNAGSSAQEFCEFPNQGVTRTGGGNLKLWGAPYNSSRTSLAPPIIVTQRERWWPSVPEGATTFTPPTYSWDCMFRRMGGRIQVAIFVYRVIGVGGAVKSYSSPANGAPSLPTVVVGGSYPNLPPVPYRRVPKATAGNGATGTTGSPTNIQVATGWEQPATLSLTGQGPFSTGYFGTAQGLNQTDFIAAQIPQVSEQWQFPGQWIIDNNSNVHRVAQGRRNSTDSARVRMSAPVPRVPNAQIYDDYELVGSATFEPTPPGIRTMHYVPAVIDANGTQLVPVYATVREL